MTTAIQNVESYLESFTEFEKSSSGSNVSWLRKLREDAFARFCHAGFPTTRDEDWRFTNVSAIARTAFSLAEKGKARVSDSDLKPWRVQDAAAQLVFVDGQFRGDLSVLRTLPASVSIVWTWSWYALRRASDCSSSLM